MSKQVGPYWQCSPNSQLDLCAPIYLDHSACEPLHRQQRLLEAVSIQILYMHAVLHAGWHAMGNAGQDAVQLEVLEGQLTWLVHIIGAVIRGRLSSSTAESQETIDGDLAARAFGLLQIVDSGYAAEPSAPRLLSSIIVAHALQRQPSIGAVNRGTYLPEAVLTVCTMP